jgi:(1->4)-alpha-D-glucan 1-alpha-D-glucosylmutase
MLNSLSQTALRCTAPGVPDLYQGAELWDLSLVDPDNRRPVDWERRRALLADLGARMGDADLRPLVRELLDGWADGRVKLYTLHQGLAGRRAEAELFRRGAYVPLPATGEAADHVCAYARHLDGRAVVTIVPRLVAALTDGGARWPLGTAAWGDTAVLLPPEAGAAPPRNALTGATVSWEARGGARVLRLAETLADFPVALLRPARGREAP